MEFLIILAFVFGAIVGSFLNVVSLRINTGVGVGGRSHCMSCGKALSWYELVPVFSYLIQLGHCRKCKSRISTQYVIVEFITGVLFALLVVKFIPNLDAINTLSIVGLVIHLIATCLLVVITVYDTRHKIIPDSFVYAFDLVALVSVFVGGSTLLHAPHIWTILAGPILALPFALVWLISRGRWMGLGDAKLAIGIGWLLGMHGGVNAVILAFWVGAVVSIIWMLFTMKKFRPRAEVPLGPYLIIGLYLVLLFGVNVMDVRMLGSLF